MLNSHFIQQHIFLRSKCVSNRNSLWDFPKNIAELIVQTLQVIGDLGAALANPACIEVQDLNAPL